MSRYYNPVTHRFVNADGFFQSGGNIFDANMSAYCRNNPVNLLDSTGCAPKTMCQLQKELTENDNLSYNITAITAAQKQGYSMNDTFIVSNGKLVPYNWGNQILYTIESFFKSFEIRAGAGYGLGITEEICGVDITLFIKSDLVSLFMSSTEGFDFGAYCDAGFSLFIDQFGWDNEYYKSYLDESKSFSTDSGTDPNKFEVFSAGEYFIAGGSISVLFNIDYMSKRFEEIWW